MAIKQKKSTHKPYVDGFVLSVPKKNLKAYRKMALDAGKVWKKYGALSYIECMGEDLKPQGDAEVMNFIELAKPKKDEVVFFSFITYKSRKHRDEVNAKVMKEMSKYAEKHKNIKMPFDMKRMAYGGFEAVVSL
jgi:uncharacterized protein YbaA (DUF1428 family)